MNITVTITVDLNVLQNASKCTISKEKIPKFFWGCGTASSPDPTPTGEGDMVYPLSRPHPRRRLRRLHSSAANPLQTTFLVRAFVHSTTTIPHIILCINLEFYK